MTLTQILSLIRVKIPAAPTSVISDANATIILNNGALEIARFTKCLPTYASFDTAADTIEYNLASLITDYLCPLETDMMHVLYYDGDEYTDLDIVTLGYMMDNYPDWLTADSGDPERVVIIGDTMFAHPAPESTITNGFMFFYVKKPHQMDSTYVYPFGGTTELSRLSPFHTLLIDYFEMEAYEVLDKSEPESNRITTARQKYSAKIELMRQELKKDATMMILRSKENRLKIPPSYADSPF